jgi:hypothetical protein
LDSSTQNPKQREMCCKKQNHAPDQIGLQHSKSQNKEEMHCESQISITTFHRNIRTISVSFIFDQFQKNGS